MDEEAAAAEGAVLVEAEAEEAADGQAEVEVEVDAEVSAATVRRCSDGDVSTAGRASGGEDADEEGEENDAVVPSWARSGSAARKGADVYMRCLYQSRWICEWQESVSTAV